MNIEFLIEHRGSGNSKGFYRKTKQQIEDQIMKSRIKRKKKNQLRIRNL